MRLRRVSTRLLWICAFLFAVELAFLPMPGIQQDEALFVAPFLRDRPALYSWAIGGRHVPVMSMAYLGAVKSWIYWPVFRFWTPGVWSIRFPESILSICTLVIFADLVRRVSASSVALAASLLLATDAVFVMMNVFDITASLQILGTITFLNLLGRGRFAAAFFVAGVSLWYKASFLFPLAGILLGFSLIHVATVRRFATVRNIVLAGAALATGSGPLIAFNLSHRGATFRAAANLPTVPAVEKLVMLRRTLDGRALEHYMFRSRFDEKIPLEGTSTGDLAMEWYRRSDMHPGSLLLPALGIALLALPFLRNSPLFRPLLFSWVALAGTIGSMFLVGDAGAGPHHTVLICPAPQFIVAATGAAVGERLGRKGVFAALVVLIAGSGVLLLSQYYRAGRMNGFSVYWTDALPDLAKAVRTEALPVTTLDWGIHNGLQIETGDRIVIGDDPTPREGVLYVRHCDGYVIDQSKAAQFRKLLASSDLHLTGERTISDREGRAIFCAFRLTGSGERR